MMRLVISIIGRPNTGKSTLFNRLVGKKLALVDDKAGVTRDRRKGAAKLYDLEFDIIDTAGYSSSPDDRLTKGMCAQTEAAICEADVIFFVVDAQKGILPEDKTLADILRSSGKSILILANKAEARSAQAGFLESWELGCGQPIAISSEHGLGMSDIRDALAIELEKQNTQLSCFLNENLEEKKEPKDKPLKMAIAGQPNAGKSTLINTLLGEDRLLVGPEAGITRDTISVEWSWKNKKVRLFDTAGIRKKAKVKEKLEKLAVADALRAIQFAEVVVILLDATIPFEKQDLQIVDLIIREGRALVIAFSKWDLIDNKKETLQELYEKTRNLLPQIAGVRLVPISSEKQYGLEKLMEAVFFANTIWNKRLSTGPLNRWLNKAVLHNPPPAVAGRRSKIKYITQVKARPPSFVLSCNRPDKIPTSYVRHLMNGLRSVFEIPGVPIRIVLRSSENPFAKKDKKRNAD